MKFDEDLGVIWRVIWNDLGFVWMNGMAFIFLPLEKMLKKRIRGGLLSFSHGYPPGILQYMTVCVYVIPIKIRIYIYIYMGTIKYRLRSSVYKYRYLFYVFAASTTKKLKTNRAPSPKGLSRV